jgi:hypothetical protein
MAMPMSFNTAAHEALPMTRRERLRRVGILCCHCLRNMGFYLSWYEAGTPFRNEQFWNTSHNNFLDIALLEWCKLFGDEKGKHRYSKVVVDPAQFKIELLADLALTDTAFTDYIKQMRTYRDEFVAHLDDKDEFNTFYVPDLTIAKTSVIFLYGYLLAQEAANDTFHEAPKSAVEFFNEYHAQGMAVYSK